MSTVDCPYLGLRAFGEEDAPNSFGREADDERLWYTVQRYPLRVGLPAEGAQLLVEEYLVGQNPRACP